MGCVPTHGVAGIWGLLSVAFFAEKDILEKKFSDEFGILKGGPWRFLGVQLLTVVAVSAWAALTTFLELLLVNLLLGLRMSEEDELIGADKVEHGIDEHDPNSTQHNGVNATQNGQEDASKSVEINLTGLEASEIDGTSRKIIHPRRRLLRPKWRKKVSFRSPRNGSLNNCTFPMNSSFRNSGVNLDSAAEWDTCNIQLAIGSVEAIEIKP